MGTIETDATDEDPAQPTPVVGTVFVKTYGCQMNVYDSERMTEALGTLGYAETSDIDAADMVILNTCHIREKAADKVYSELGRLRDIKQARSAAGLDTIVAVAGCVAQAEGGEILRRAPAVDLVLGPQNYHRLPELMASLRAGQGAIVETSFPEEDKFDHLPTRRQARRAPGAVTAFLTVQEGCDKFCTFCVVPYTRGAEMSRPVAGIIDEATSLVAQGVCELTLLGQNVNAYHGQGPDGAIWGLAELIARLARIDGLERLRYTTSHPRDMTDDLIAAHRDQAKLMPYLHLPFQSGSDRILATMNRKHTASEYLAVVDRVRRARPDIALSTDIIVGFPGESDDDFAATLDLIRHVGFAQAYSFKYSPRPGTPAASMDGRVCEPVKAERLARLQELLDSNHRSFNSRSIGRVMPVLFDRMGSRPGQLIGRSPYQQAVHADAPTSLLGQIAPVEIQTGASHSLHGVLRTA